MTIQENISLAQYTTFKIGGKARFFCIVTNMDEVKEAVIFAKEKGVPFFVLGGGSNILVSDEGFGGLVIKVEIKGITKEKNKEGKREEIVSVGAGEVWDSFVEYTITNGLNGLENLSAIPGNVGATPVQNIGAYGTEVQEYIYTVHVFDTQLMQELTLSNGECQFGYRDSVFKHEKGRYIITQVDFSLKKHGVVNIEYRDLKEYFNDQAPTPLQVREAVISIRRSKLPDWNTWGTAGSFFKNPIISKEKFDELKEKYVGIAGFPEADGRIKIPLGWVLDNVCHAKGVMNGAVGTYEKQALVVITKPGATALQPQ